MSKELKNAIIISLNKDITEISQLAESIDYQVIKTFIQNRLHPDVNTYIGIGKLNEIKDYINQQEIKIDLILINGELRPSQWFTLEKEFEIQVFDRIKLILMIFKDRAKRKEAQLQVRLAELEYEKPYVKELIHRTRSGEHPGFMAGGEYQVDDYYEMIKKQMKNIKQKLSKIEQNRLVLRKHRHKSGFYLVSLAGYTNAGKSSLLNVLSNEKVTVENRLFSTLSTITRKIDDDKLPILLTDTVGFIKNLPIWIIKAFHSTLEEIKESDLILLVVDISDPLEIIFNKIKTSIKQLIDLQVNSPVILILNKVDLKNNNEVENVRELILDYFDESITDTVALSVITGYGITNLINVINDSLPNLIYLEMEFPLSEKLQPFISWVYDKTFVISITYEKKIILKLKCNEHLYKKIQYNCKKYHGIIH